MADEEVEEEKKGKGKLIIIIAAVLLLAGGGAAFMLMGGGDEEAAEEAVEVEEPLAELVYVDMDPAFVVNLQDERGKRRLMKLELSVGTRDPEVQTALTAHTPKVRNALVLLFSRQVYEELVPHEGKMALSAAALDEIKLVLESERVEGDVEEVFFRSLVIQ